MTLHNGKQLAQIIKESIDNFDITNRFKYSKPCINKQLISSESSFDQSVDDFIIEQLNDSESHDFIKDLTEFGMAAHYVDITSRGIRIRPINTNAMHAVMPAVIGGLKHDIVIVDDIEIKENIFSINRNQYQKGHSSEKRMELVDAIMFQELKKLPKENHPHGWYRKFEKKRF